MERIDSKTWHAMRDAEIAAKLKKPISQPNVTARPAEDLSVRLPASNAATRSPNGTHR